MMAGDEAGDYVVEELTEPNLGSELLANFDTFRQDGLFCDFKLHVGHETFHVHRLVLAGCSDYFRALFSHGMQDSNTREVHLKDVPLDGVRPLIQFAYSGNLPLSLTNVADILAAATFLQVTHAISLCERFLRARMTFHNADRLVALGCNHGLTSLRRHHTDMVLENFFEFAATDKFLELDADTLAGYLENDALRTSTEGRLLKQVLLWYNHDPVGRDKDAYKVMEKVRFTLDGWPTIEYAMEVEPFVSNKQCSELLNWCHRYMRCASRKHLVSSHRTRVRFHRRTLVQIGGVRLQPAVYIDLLDDVSVDPPAGHGVKTGGTKNTYFHRGLGDWFPLGVVCVTEARSHGAMVAVNDFGVLVGGYLYTHNFEDTQRHATNDVTLFTPGGFAMWDLQHMQEERAQHAVVHTPGLVYAIGGKNDSRTLRSVECFYLEEEKWRYVQPLRKSLYDHAGASVGNMVYVSGGVESGQVTDRLLCYDHGRDCWEELNPMLTARCAHAMASLEKQLVVCGGRVSLDSSRCLAAVEVYSLELRQWTHLTPMRYDCSDMVPVVLEGNLLIVGGENSVGDLLDVIQQYEPKTKTWGTFGRLPFPTRNLACCALTIKETNDGMEETDSLTEAYSAKFDQEESYAYSSVSSNELEDYYAPDWQVI